DTDNPNDIQVIKQFCAAREVFASECTVYNNGGAGAIELAKKIMSMNRNQKFDFLYSDDNSVIEKIKKICIDYYGAKNVIFEKNALIDIDIIMKHIKVIFVFICLL
ncbi:MAG: formate--tetrahydrofolate ligase, partial [Candidatus Bathyarchaeia archaeon]